MANAFSHCSECPLCEFWDKKKIPVYKGRKIVKEVPYREVPFRGPLNAEVMIVGESPGSEEVWKGQPFVGDSGKTSDDEFRKNGYDPSFIFYANSCRCLIPKKEISDKQIKKALECCRPALEAAIKKIKPKLIILYGGIALQQVLHQQGISKRRGRIQYSKEFDCAVIPVFHPAFCLYDAKNFALWRPDIAQIVNFIKSGFSLPKQPDLELKTVDSISFLLEKKDFVVAVDTETQGLDWMNPNSLVISFSVSDRPSAGYNVWLYAEDEEGEEVIKWPRKQKGSKIEEVEVRVKKTPHFDKKIKELKELLERSDIKKIMANGNYDLHRFRQLGIENVRSYILDIQLGMHSLDPDVFKQASLKDIQTALLPDRMDHKSEFSRESKEDMLLASKEDPDKVASYAAADAASTIACGARIIKELKKDKALLNYYVNLAHPVTTQVLFDIERNGICFDIENLCDIKEKVAERLKALQDEFIFYTSRKVIAKYEDNLNLSRARFIRDALKAAGLKPKEFTPTGEATLSRKILEQMQEELDDDHPAQQLLSCYIRWGPLQKLYTTYLKGYEKYVKSDGRLHTQISMTGTATGRTSSSRPNLQNAPKHNKEVMQYIRSLLIAPPGKSLVAFDYSQMELRWIAQRGRDKEFIRVFKSGEDIHANTALEMLRIKSKDEVSEEVFKEARNKAKPVNFGFAYGQMPKGFQVYARNNYGLKLSLEECTEYRNLYFKRYPGLIRWHEAEIAAARKWGFCRTPFGFIRRTPNILSDDFMKRSEDERVAINTPIQAAGNATTLFAALQAKRMGLIDNQKVKLVLFIHDELIFEVEDDYIETFAKKMIECMSNLEEPLKKYFGIELIIPFEAEGSFGKNLACMQEI